MPGFEIDSICRMADNGAATASTPGGGIEDDPYNGLPGQDPFELARAGKLPPNGVFVEAEIGIYDLGRRNPNYCIVIHNYRNGTAELQENTIYSGRYQGGRYAHLRLESQYRAYFIAFAQNEDTVSLGWLRDDVNKYPDGSVVNAGYSVGVKDRDNNRALLYWDRTYPKEHQQGIDTGHTSVIRFFPSLDDPDILEACRVIMGRLTRRSTVRHF